MIDLLAAKRACTPMGNRYYGNKGGGNTTTYTQNVPRWIPRLRPWRGKPPEQDTMPL